MLEKLTDSLKKKKKKPKRNSYLFPTVTNLYLVLLARGSPFSHKFVSCSLFFGSFQTYISQNNLSHVIAVASVVK